VQLLQRIEDSLARGPWLAGRDFSLADAAVIPYVLRLDLLKMKGMWEGRKGVEEWYQRMCARPSVKKEMLDRMTEQDRAPFQKLEPDPWPKVKEIAWVF
jgi:glutathione S-transferase